MMPLVVGNEKTVKMILYYSLSLIPTTIILSFYYSYFFTISANSFKLV